MNAACGQFRSRLASLLSGRVENDAFGALAWHEHLLTCGDCRALLEAEEALELLLASLPEPHLPPELARRVLSRLEPLRLESTTLDALLERSSEPEVPADLARSVLARLAGARRVEHEERALDALLVAVTEERAPADLARRVLLGLQEERERARRRTLQPAATRIERTVHHRDADAVRAASRPPSRRFGAEPSKGTGLRTLRPQARVRRVLLAASITLAIGAAAWLWSALGSFAAPEQELVDRGPAQPALPGGPSDAPRRVPSLDPAGLPSSAEPPDDLLASLDLLESWELVTDESLEVALTTAEDFDVLLTSLDAQEASAAGGLRR